MLMLATGFSVGGILLSVTINERLVVPFTGWPSETVTVMVAVSETLAAGTNERVALDAGLLYFTTGCGISAGLLDVAVTVSDCDSLTEPDEIPFSEKLWVPGF